VLGIDPGTIRTGWGVVERRGSVVRGVMAGVIKTNEREELAFRLNTIFEGLRVVIASHAPTEVAVEDVFYARHAQSALKLGHARGVALLAAAQAGLSVAAYPPALVKRVIGGGGRADKTQIARMVGAILGWRELPSTDATDALAVAITHANAMTAARSIARGVPPRSP